MRKQCLCGKFVFPQEDAFKAVLLDCVTSLMIFSAKKKKNVIIYYLLFLSYYIFVLFLQNVHAFFHEFSFYLNEFDGFFHTMKTMYSCQAPKRTKKYHESTSVISITHNLTCEDTFYQVWS